MDAKVNESTPEREVRVPHNLALIGHSGTTVDNVHVCQCGAIVVYHTST